MSISRSTIRHILTAALVSAAACGGEAGPGPTAAATASQIGVVTAPAATLPVATSAAYVVKVSDASGNGVAGVSVTFSASGSVTLISTSVVTDGQGHAATQLTTGTIAGSATLRASTMGVSAPAVASIIVTAGAAAKVAVSPRTIRLVSVGDTVRLAATAQDQYGNTATGSAISFSVVDASLVSVDASGLVRALRPGGNTFVISSAAGKSDTTTVTVLAPGSTVCTGLEAPTTMAVGDVQTFSGAQYACLSGTPSGSEFTVVAFNSSANGNTAVNVSVTGTGIAAPPALAKAPASGSALALRSAFGAIPSSELRRDESFHLGLLSRIRQERSARFSSVRAARRQAASRAVSPSSMGAVSQAGIPSSAKVGDVVTLNVSGNSCSGATNRGLRVEAIGSKSIILADTLNPAGGFSTVDYERFAVRFDTLVYPLDVEAFGAPSDLDKNGKVAILFTRSVNELVTSTSGYYVGGFFNPRDLFPRVDAVNGNCPGSNEGEMFYMLVPAPDGINGVQHTTGFVDSITTGIIAHEFQHLINGSRRFYVNTTAEEFEEVWLNEGLSHIAEELLYYRESRLGSRQNMNDSTIRIINRPTYGNWKDDVSSNFVRLLSYLRAPAANSPYADDDELATRGAIWSFLRYAADRLGPTDGTLWQRFTNSTVTGMATMQLALGTDPTPFFRDWTVANYIDDYGVPVAARYMHPSWNYRNIFTNTFREIPTYPLVVSALAENVKVDFAVRGGSAGYARLAVAAGKEGLVTFSSAGGLPVSVFQFMVIRTK